MQVNRKEHGWFAGGSEMRLTDEKWLEVLENVASGCSLKTASLAAGMAPAYLNDLITKDFTTSSEQYLDRQEQLRTAVGNKLKKFEHKYNEIVDEQGRVEDHRQRIKDYTPTVKEEEQDTAMKNSNIYTVIEEARTREKK